MSGRPADSRPVRVMIVDDQDIVRRGLATLLELDNRIRVVGEAADGLEALRKTPQLKPEVALVDVRMPRMDGVELTAKLAADHPEVAVLILTTFDEDEYIFGGLRAGAKGYLLKNVSAEELVRTIEKVGRGESVLEGPAAARVIAELNRLGAAQVRSHDPSGILSEREVEVAGLVGRGANNAEIARALYISEGTARNQVSKILKKLGLRDRTRLAVHAVERGWTRRP